MRLRSSLRCSKKVIAPAGSSGGGVICELDSGSGTGSGRMLVVMEGILGISDGSRFGFRLGPFFRRAWDGFGHELAQATGELRQLLWPENDQDHQKQHNHVGNAQHYVWEPSKGSMGIIERVSAAVKPEFASNSVCYNFSLSCHAR